jgi:O-acetylserine/cysteine efflux transporter
MGLTLFAGQFLFQFFGIASGLPPGLASVIVQTQAFVLLGLALIAVPVAGGREAGRRKDLPGARGEP